MKRLICLILCGLIFVGAFLPTVAAASVQEGDRIIYEDGSYLEITDTHFIDMSDEESTFSFIERILELFRAIINMLKGVKIVTETKYASYYSSNGDLLWCVCLEGEFTYNGKKAVCSSSNLSWEIFDSDWRMLSSSHSEQDNVATGSFVMKQYKLGVPLKEIERTMTLTCDEKGNVK